MRYLFQSLFLAASVVILLSGAEPALARDYKYCLQGRHWGIPGNCRFSTFKQCQAAASGTNSFCGINPRWPR